MPRDDAWCCVVMCDVAWCCAVDSVVGTNLGRSSCLLGGVLSTQIFEFSNFSNFRDVQFLHLELLENFL